VRSIIKKEKRKKKKNRPRLSAHSAIVSSVPGTASSFHIISEFSSRLTESARIQHFWLDSFSQMPSCVWGCFRSRSHRHFDGLATTVTHPPLLSSSNETRCMVHLLIRQEDAYGPMTAILDVFFKPLSSSYPALMAEILCLFRDRSMFRLLCRTLQCSGHSKAQDSSSVLRSDAPRDIPEHHGQWCSLHSPLATLVPVSTSTANCHRNHYFATSSGYCCARVILARSLALTPNFNPVFDFCGEKFLMTNH
jgi:hypothetical protein